MARSISRCSGNEHETENSKKRTKFRPNNDLIQALDGGVISAEFYGETVMMMARQIVSLRRDQFYSSADLVGLEHWRAQDWCWRILLDRCVDSAVADGIFNLDFTEADHVYQLGPRRVPMRNAR